MKRKASAKYAKCHPEVNRRSSVKYAKKHPEVGRNASAKYAKKKNEKSVETYSVNDSTEIYQDCVVNEYLCIEENEGTGDEET